MLTHTCTSREDAEPHTLRACESTDLVIILSHCYQTFQAIGGGTCAIVQRVQGMATDEVVHERSLVELE